MFAATKPKLKYSIFLSRRIWWNLILPVERRNFDVHWCLTLCNVCRRYWLMHPQLANMWQCWQSSELLPTRKPLSRHTKSQSSWHKNFLKSVAANAATEDQRIEISSRIPACCNNRQWVARQQLTNSLIWSTAESTSDRQSLTMRRAVTFMRISRSVTVAGYSTVKSVYRRTEWMMKPDTTRLQLWTLRFQVQFCVNFPWTVQICRHTDQLWARIPRFAGLRSITWNVDILGRNAYNSALTNAFQSSSFVALWFGYMLVASHAYWKTVPFYTWWFLRRTINRGRIRWKDRLLLIASGQWEIYDTMRVTVIYEICLYDTSTARLSTPRLYLSHEFFFKTVMACVLNKLRGDAGLKTLGYEQTVQILFAATVTTFDQ